MAGICNMLCLVIMAAVFTNVFAADYCNLQSCKWKNAEHTMCKYKAGTLASSCIEAKQRGLSQDEINRVVRKHNQFRQQVASGQEKRGSPGPQPAAKYMPNLSWNSELATIAQRWCDQCTMGHDGCRDVEKYQVGQNMGMTMYSAENNSPVEDIVTNWYNEVPDLDNKQVDNFNPSNFGKVGHYTQVVWANTTEIGCGRIKYKDDKWNNHLLCCNYGPSGNWNGQKIYERK